MVEEDRGIDVPDQAHTTGRPAVAGGPPSSAAAAAPAGARPGSGRSAAGAQ
jgi:hypothetical protein